MILDRLRDIGPRLALALQRGVSRERIANRSTLHPLESRQAVDRLAENVAISYHQAEAIGRALDLIEQEAPSGER